MPQAAPRHDAGRPKPPPRPRGTTAERGYGSRWQRQRALFLARPENAVCCVPDCNQPAAVVDHVIPHRGDYRLLWDVANWQPMCARHHNQKTARGE